MSLGKICPEHASLCMLTIIRHKALLCHDVSGLRRAKSMKAAGWLLGATLCTLHLNIFAFKEAEFKVNL